MSGAEERSDEGLSDEEINDRFAWLFSKFSIGQMAEMIVDAIFYPLYNEDNDAERKVMEFRVDRGNGGGEVTMLDVTEHVDELERQSDRASREE